jgi:5-(carboxyamino)imidazole ribonucleotide synthase
MLHDHPEWHFHDYGKNDIRPQRKLGHITVVGTDVNELLATTDMLRGDN